jgi:hypothetical protein
MKFEDVSEDVNKLFESVREEYFPELEGAYFKLIFRNKKKVSDGSFVVAEIKKLGELNKFFSSAEIDREDGYDYAIIIDKNVYNNLHEDDKKRVLRHELRHCSVNHEKKQPYSTRRHTIEDFYEDVELESQPGGDPRWHERIGDICASIYDEDETVSKE